MNTKAQTASKFTFDTEFRTEGDLVSNAARARLRKTFTQEEIDGMCTKAHDEGVKSGQVRAAEKIAAAIEAMNKTLHAALSASRDEIEILREDAVGVAFCAARKLAKNAIASFPEGEVEDTLREAMHQAIGEPRIVLRASQKVLDALAEKLAGIAHEEGYDGRIVASADPAITGSDCRIEWRGGGAEHSLAALEAAVAAVIARRFSQSSNTQVMKG